MRLKEWAEAERGRAKALAERFEVTPGAISQWFTNGVPRDRILDVHAFTGREVSVEELLAPPVANQPEGEAA